VRDKPVGLPGRINRVLLREAINQIAVGIVSPGRVALIGKLRRRDLSARLRPQVPQRPLSEVTESIVNKSLLVGAVV
jgi:hypothetical protein